VLWKIFNMLLALNQRLVSEGEAADLPSAHHHPDQNVRQKGAKSNEADDVCLVPFG
jgi:hypothetical protein